MFKNILMPVSSEFYSKEVLRRTVFLAKKFDSKVDIVYVIEKKTIEQVDKRSDSFRTQHDKDKIKKDLVRKQRNAAKDIVFRDAKKILERENIRFDVKTVEGDFNAFIKSITGKKHYDLVLMGFEKGCRLDYSFLYDVDVPIWVESGSENNSVLAICSNLAPNQKVPRMAKKIADHLQWKLHMLYVVDIEDRVEVDKKGERSDKKPERDLLFSSQNFIKKMEKKNIDVTSVKGSLEKETVKAAEEFNPGLVVIGREKKKRGLFGLPTSNVKQKMAEKCKYSILFIN